MVRVARFAREIALRELRSISGEPTAGPYQSPASGVLDSELIAAIGQVSELLDSGRVVDVVVEDDGDRG